MYHFPTPKGSLPDQRSLSLKATPRSPDYQYHDRSQKDQLKGTQEEAETTLDAVNFLMLNIFYKQLERQLTNTHKKKKIPKAFYQGQQGINLLV